MQSVRRIIVMRPRRWLFITAVLLMALCPGQRAALAANEQPTLLVAAGSEDRLPGVLGCPPDHAAFWTSDHGTLVPFEPVQLLAARLADPQ